LKQLKEVTPDNVTSLDDVKSYSKAVEDLFNVGENEQTIDNYKQSVLKMLQLQNSTTKQTSSSPE